MLAIKQELLLMSLKLHTAWGPVDVQPQVFTVIPWDDNSLILGRITLGMLGISPKTELDRIARGNFDYLTGLYR